MTVRTSIRELELSRLKRVQRNWVRELTLARGLLCLPPVWKYHSLCILLPVTLDCKLLQNSQFTTKILLCLFEAACKLQPQNGILVHTCNTFSFRHFCFWLHLLDVVGIVRPHLDYWVLVDYWQWVFRQLTVWLEVDYCVYLVYWRHSSPADSVIAYIYKTWWMSAVWHHIWRWVA